MTITLSPLNPLVWFGLVYTLWIYYLAVMNLKRARDGKTLARVAYYLGLPALWLGLVLDVAVNWCVLTPILLEVPREFTVTSRLKRHKKEGEGWRKAFAVWVGDNLLDDFDPDGKHL